MRAVARFPDVQYSRVAASRKQFANNRANQPRLGCDEALIDRINRIRDCALEPNNSQLKLTRCPHSLTATLTALPSMSLIPFAPFSTLPRQIFDPLPLVRSELEFRRGHVLPEMRER